MSVHSSPWEVKLPAAYQSSTWRIEITSFLDRDSDNQNEDDNDDEDDDEKSPVNSLACCVISPDVTCPPVGLEVVLKGGLFDTVFIMVV